MKKDLLQQNVWAVFVDLFSFNTVASVRLKKSNLVGIIKKSKSN